MEKALKGVVSDVEVGQKRKRKVGKDAHPTFADFAKTTAGCPPGFVSSWINYVYENYGVRAADARAVLTEYPAWKSFVECVCSHLESV